MNKIKIFLSNETAIVVESELDLNSFISEHCSHKWIELDGYVINSYHVISISKEDEE